VTEAGKQNMSLPETMAMTFFNRSGMTISQTAEIIAEILHGVQFDARTEGTHWRRVQSATSSESRGTVVIRA
jgi:hypothetical protein